MRAVAERAIPGLLCQLVLVTTLFFVLAVTASYGQAALEFASLTVHGMVIP